MYTTRSIGLMRVARVIPMNAACLGTIAQS